MQPSLIQVLQIAALVFWTLAGLQAATQTAARLLAYDPQLGAPLLEMAGAPVYPPWRFAFGEHAPTTFAASYPAILLGVAAGASHALLLLFVPDAAAYRDPFALAARPAPNVPWLPAPNARLSRLIADAEAEVLAAKRDAMERAVRVGTAEAAKRLLPRQGNDEGMRAKRGLQIPWRQRGRSGPRTTRPGHRQTRSDRSERTPSRLTWHNRFCRSAMGGPWTVRSRSPAGGH